MTTIRIGDIGTTSIYTLAGNVLTMTHSGGCADALVQNGCDVNESMDDADIEAAVYDSWSEGYEGDPASNDLNITVTR